MRSIRLLPNIVLFGDSLTEYGFASNGWAALLANAYIRRADVLNRGFSGYNTRHALELIPRVFGDPKCKRSEDRKETTQSDGSAVRTLFCTVLLGANDATLPAEDGSPRADGFLHVPLDEFEANLSKIIGEIRERLGEETPVLLLTPPPLHAATWDMHCPCGPDTRTNGAAKTYASVVHTVGQQYSCPVVDVFELLGGHEEDDMFEKHLIDGLHLSERGNALLFEGLMKLLKEQFPHLVPMEDGDGKYGTSGIPKEGKIWQDLS